MGYTYPNFCLCAFLRPYNLLTICLPTYLPTYLIYPSICSSIYRTNHLPVYLPIVIYLAIHLPICLTTYLPTIWLASMCRPIYLSISTSIYLSTISIWRSAPVPKSVLLSVSISFISITLQPTTLYIAEQPLHPNASSPSAPNSQPLTLDALNPKL